MSFWDVLKAIGHGLLNQVEKKQASIERYEDKYRNLDHEQLVRKYRSSGDAKLAAGILLKEKSNKNH